MSIQIFENNILYNIIINVNKFLIKIVNLVICLLNRWFWCEMVFFEKGWKQNEKKGKEKCKNIAYYKLKTRHQ